MCHINIPLGLCEGCMRTKEEIAAWPEMGLEQRQKVMLVVEQRKREMGQGC
jgi:predicted Fe-S protein YdhL (DUF1289 family)